jgi:thimet oligopeptidase
LLREGLRFEEVVDAEVWHSDVQVFSVFDLSSNELLGYFYLDIYKRFNDCFHCCNLFSSFFSLFSFLRDLLVQALNIRFIMHNREGKYGHTCVAALQNGALSSTGARQVIFANLFLLMLLPKLLKHICFLMCCIVVNKL